ncbi:MAG: ABC transporter permease [Ignavibacteria bacterium]|jgi:putative ABC transport system permease protein
MFNLKKEIKKWKSSIRKNSSLEDGYIEELESHLRDEIEKDVSLGISEEEAFNKAKESIGNLENVACDYYKSDTTSIISKPNWEAPSWMPELIWNYFKIAFRNITRQKVYSFINIMGLAVGITCFLLLVLFINHELSFDECYEKSDEIYRIYVKQDIAEIKDYNSKTPGLLGPSVLNQIPETVTFTRLGYFGQYRFRREDKAFYEGSVYAVDSTFFDLFTLPFIEGNPKTALTKPNSIVLTKSVAGKYFGDENPVGKTLEVDDYYMLGFQDKDITEKSTAFLITGLIEDFPDNSHFECDFLTSIYTYDISEYWLDLWFSTYVLLDKGTDIHSYERNLDKIVKQNIAPLVQGVLGITYDEFLNSGNEYAYALQPLSSIYLYTKNKYDINLNTEWGNVRNSDITYIYIFSAVAVFILLIAVINFMNLATARSEKRSKEVGIRKTLGSKKTDLIKQFISEAIFMSFFSVVLSLVILQISLPYFNNLVGKELYLNLFDNFYTVPLLFLFVLFVGLLAGSYPAFYLSSFDPAKVLKSNTNKEDRKRFIRSFLVILQFSATVVLIICTFVINDQLDYMQNKNLGFNKDLLYVINDIKFIGDKSKAFKEELLKNSNVKFVSNSSQLFRGGIPGSGYLYDKKIGSDPYACKYVETDYDFLNTYELELLQGRYFSKEFSTDTVSVVINETAAKFFGDVNPVGKELTRIGNSEWEGTFKIIGVIKDFNFESLHHNVRPLVLHLKFPSDSDNYFNVRLASNDYTNTIKFIEQTWKEFSNGNGISSRFVDETLARLYDNERKTKEVATIFSLLTIFIACLGLFGLASFVTEQKVKEIGIRKVLGASVVELVTLLSKEFTKWILIANIIAWPIAYYLMKNWLQDFAFRTEITLWSFVFSALFALFIALATVSFKTVRAALVNPVKSIKYE